jgi:hypothetical protein
MSGGGGGGSGDAQTSMNQAAELRGVSTRRWEGREWVWLVLALVPIVVVAIVAILI